jgi:hypothetical protein
MNEASKFNDDRGWHSLLGGRRDPNPFFGNGPIHDRFQNFLYDQHDLANIQLKEWGESTFRRRMEKAGARFILPAASPWSSKKPDDWVFDSPLGGYLVIDREAAEKILVLGLP